MSPEIPMVRYKTVQPERTEAENDLDILKKYSMYRQEVVRIFSDTMRRRRLEGLAGQVGVVIPTKILKGIG